MDFNYGTQPAVGNRIAGMAWLYPAEKPVGLVGAHVDAAMTHGRAKIFMPVGAVEGMSLCCEKG